MRFLSAEYLKENGNVLIDYINEHGTDGGVFELEDGDYYHLVWLESDQMWVAGSACNVGMIAEYVYDARDVSKDEALQEFAQDLQTATTEGFEYTSADCWSVWSILNGETIYE